MGADGGAGANMVRLEADASGRAPGPGIRDPLVSRKTTILGQVWTLADPPMGREPRFGTRVLPDHYSVTMQLGLAATVPWAILRSDAACSGVSCGGQNVIFSTSPNSTSYSTAAARYWPAALQWAGSLTIFISLVWKSFSHFQPTFRLPGLGGKLSRLCVGPVEIGIGILELPLRSRPGQLKGVPHGKNPDAMASGQFRIGLLNRRMHAFLGGEFLIHPAILPMCPGFQTQNFCRRRVLLDVGDQFPGPRLI